MKKPGLLFAVLFTILISGCTAQSPAEIIKDSAANSRSLGSYEISYGYSISMFQTMGMNGSMVIYKKQDKTRLDTEMSMADAPGSAFVISSYQLPSGTFSCTAYAGSATCIEGDSGESYLIDPAGSLDAMKSVAEKGIAELKYLNTATVAGRSCHNISSDINVEKLSMLTQEELSVFGMNVTSAEELEAVKVFNITQCYDSETGIPLYISILMEMDMSGMGSDPFTFGTMLLEINMAAESYEPNKQLQDSVFELPAEVTELCAVEGEEFSRVYTDMYMENCCEGLTEWEAGMDTRVSVAGECYETGLLAGSPIGICISCGDGYCDPFLEDNCNCPADCTEWEDSVFPTVEEFCNDTTVISEFTDECQENLQNLTLCDLCEWNSTA